MSFALNLDIFKPVVLDRDKIKVSHLQFVDDTILLGEANSNNDHAMRWILVLFQLLSDLRVNYNKCSISGVNMDQNQIQEMTTVLGCEVGYIPFTYLGLKIGMLQKERQNGDRS